MKIIAADRTAEYKSGKRERNRYLKKKRYLVEHQYGTYRDKKTAEDKKVK